jgi:hypothetical protein
MHYFIHHSRTKFVRKLFGRNKDSFNGHGAEVIGRCVLGSSLMPVISVNKVVDEKRILGKWG